MVVFKLFAMRFSLLDYRHRRCFHISSSVLPEFLIVCEGKTYNICIFPRTNMNGNFDLLYPASMMGLLQMFVFFR